MGRTYTFSTDASNPDEQVIAQGYCRQVTIYEDAGGATASFLVRQPLATSSQLTIPAGGQFTFYADPGKSFLNQQVVGYVSSSSGSLTMAQVEK